MAFNRFESRAECPHPRMVEATVAERWAAAPSGSRLVTDLITGEQRVVPTPAGADEVG